MELILFEVYPALFIVLCITLGLIIGSFLNVLIYRTPIILNDIWQQECIEFLELENTIQHKSNNLGIVFPRSHCPSCKTNIQWYYNIPLLGYILLRSRCSNCNAKISLSYPMVELLTACAFVIQGFYFDISFEWVVSCILTSGLITISMIDINHKIIPDQFSLSLLWLGLIINIFNTFTTLDEAVLGAVFGYISLWLFAKGYEKFAGKPAMGHGDFKLLACGGAWLGWTQLPFIVLASSLVASILGLFLILIRFNTKDTLIPFGPYLSAAIWISLIWGDDIMIAYYSFFDLGF